MPKYRKKPVVIEARQYNGRMSSAEDLCHWMNDIDNNPEIKEEDIVASFDEMNGLVTRFGIHTLEGEMAVSEGDWIIQGVQGEFYPCKPDIFEATYDPVGDGMPGKMYASLEKLEADEDEDD